jgi:predicted DNA-binding protein YlxM (UPF0122 family)
MEIANMTPNDFLKIIQEETLLVEKIPDGWYCADDLCKMWSVKRSSVHEKIQSGKKLGYVTEKKFFVKKNGNRKIPYYKFHEKENNQKNDQRKVMEDTLRSCRKNKRSR